MYFSRSILFNHKMELLFCWKHFLFMQNVSLLSKLIDLRYIVLYLSSFSNSSPILPCLGLLEQLAHFCTVTDMIKHPWCPFAEHNLHFKTCFNLTPYFTYLWFRVRSMEETWTDNVGRQCRANIERGAAQRLSLWHCAEVRDDSMYKPCCWLHVVLRPLCSSGPHYEGLTHINHLLRETSPLFFREALLNGQGGKQQDGANIWEEMSRRAEPCHSSRFKPCTFSKTLSEIKSHISVFYILIFFSWFKIQEWSYSICEWLKAIHIIILINSILVWTQCTYVWV